MKIKRATGEDIPAMARLWAMLVLSENPKAVPDIEAWSDVQHEMMQIDTYYAFIVENEGKVVGFNNGLICIDFETGERYVDGGHFFVLPEYRNGRAGAMLHRMSFRVAKDKGCVLLRRKVRASNKRMVDRFLKKGHTVREYIIDEPIGGKR